jgi:hypothetical protein
MKKPNLLPLLGLVLLLLPHFKNPAPGLAGPGHWKNVESDIPGSAYQMMDYGLFENFNLISYE